MRYIQYVFFLVVLLLGCSDSRSIKEERLGEWIEETKPMLREGDLAFRRGIGMAGRFVTIAGGSDEVYSHVGIITYNGDSTQWLVCHAVPGEAEIEGDIDRIKCETIESFFSINRASHGKVVRVECSDSIAKSAVEVAMRLWNDKVAFDHNYNLADTTSFYCTQMVMWAYGQHGIDLVEDRNHPAHLPGMHGVYIFPSDIEKSSLLSYITYY